MSQFIRLKDNRIETVVRVYQKNGITVAFVSNIHDGPVAYYDALISHLQKCDHVLYEHKGRDLDRISDSLQPYRGLFDIWSVLGCKPVPRDNFVTLQHVMENKTKTWIWCDVWFSDILKEIQQSLPSLEEITAYFSVIFKKYVNEQYYIPANNLKFFQYLSKFFPQDVIGSILLRISNAKIIEMLSEYLKKQYTNIGILYGASHGDSVQAFLLNNAGFSIVDEYWFVNRD